MTQPLPTAALRAEPDAFDISRPQLMGRHAAGNSFLRAVVAARDGGPIWGYAPGPGARRDFARIVHEMDPEAPINLIHGDHLNELSKPGALFLGDAMVPSFARLRLRAGVAAYSLVGVTHTTATDSTMDAICDLLTAPVAPWDALICTSSAVLETVRRLHSAQADYLRWRLGPGAQIETLQLPVIPLGIHCDDFQATEAERAAAREALGLEPDEVAGLYVGRLLFHGKAHPVAMYEALQTAAERTGRRIALIQCGWAPNDPIMAAFKDGAVRFAPSVRTIFLDGREPEARRRAWAAGDIFFSLSDNVQETFGLTPVEAMAAGLPVVVSDWNGYRDTVRDGVDGFRVPTWAPAPGAGLGIARAYESGSMNYDYYGWATGASTAVERTPLYDAVTALVERPQLRRQMGDAGRQHAREVFDWSVVYRQYQALYAELAARRAAEQADPSRAARWAAAPREDPGRLDPFHTFGHYPTRRLSGATLLRRRPEATAERLAAYLAHPLFGEVQPRREVLEAILAAADPVQGVTVVQMAQRLQLGQPALARAAGLLVKLGLVDASLLGR